MPAWILKILKYLPGLGTLWDKMSGESAKVEEIKAETEQADIRGFHRTGRVSAAHAWKYAKVVIAMMIACSLCAALFSTGAKQNALDLLDGFVSAISKLFSVDM